MRLELCTATHIIRKPRLMEAVCTTDFSSGLNHSAAIQGVGKHLGI